MDKLSSLALGAAVGLVSGVLGLTVLILLWKLALGITKFFVGAP